MNTPRNGHKRFSLAELSTKVRNPIADKSAPKAWAETVSNHTGPLVDAPMQSSAMIKSEFEALQAKAIECAPETRRTAPVKSTYRPDHAKTMKSQRRMFNASDMTSDGAKLKKAKALTVPMQVQAMIQKEKGLSVSIAKKQAKLTSLLTHAETLTLVDSINGLIRCRMILKQRVRNMLDHLETKGVELAG